MNNKQTILAIDFDGTIVEHDYPNIGELKEGVVEYINKLHEEGFYIIIWTVRDGLDLEDVKTFLKENSIHYDAINENSMWFLERLNEDPRFGKEYHEPRKIYADIYIDDKNLGKDGEEDWEDIYNEIHNHEI